MLKSYVVGLLLSSCRFANCVIALPTIVLGLVAGLEVAHAEDATRQHFWVDVALYSFHPDESIDSHRSHGGGGGAGVNGTFGLGVAVNNRRFHVSVKVQRKAQRLVAQVKIAPKKGDRLTKPRTIDLDLSDLSARSVDVARDEDGRVYRLNLTPSIQKLPRPRAFRAGELRLDSFSFPASPVVLNDAQYVGQLSMSHGTLAFLEIPGHALVEFSLLRLTDAEPLGVLQGGTINIRHPPSGTTLRITNVKNGVFREVLPGGPWQVWVRWKKPTKSIAEYRELMREQIATLKEKASNGDIYLSPERLLQLVMRSESEHIGLLKNGLRQVEQSEIVP